IPLSGDYDGDAKTDITVYDPIDAIFQANYSSGISPTYSFGPKDRADEPLPAVYPSRAGGLSTSSVGGASDFTPLSSSSSSAATTATPPTGGPTGPLGKAAKHAAAKSHRHQHATTKTITRAKGHALRALSHGTKVTASDLAIEDLWD